MMLPVMKSILPADRTPAAPLQADRLLQDAVVSVLRWYPAVRRMLPWRRSPSPYQIWVSEIMLQQTRIDTVIPYYTRFLKELPDVASLAAVPDDRLLKLWEGLGYYSRARNLKKAAVLLMREYGGRLPPSAEELRKLPGIGDYTAGAIASLAFGLPEPAVDGNVLRVITRLTACGDDIAEQKTKRRVSESLRGCYPEGYSAGLLTEGLMELGETVCLPNGSPRCDVCPLSALCRAHRESRELSFPVKSAKAPRRAEEKTVLLLRCGTRYAIRRRPAAGLLAGLWEFPTVDGALSADQVPALAAEYGLSVFRVTPQGSAKHIFTHVEWRMSGYLLDCGEEAPGFLWRTPEEILASFPLPTAFRPWQRLLSEEKAGNPG